MVDIQTSGEQPGGLLFACLTRNAGVTGALCT